MLKLTSRIIKSRHVSQAFTRIVSTQPVQNVIELQNNKYESDDYFNLTPKILSYLDLVRHIFRQIIYRL